MILSQGMVAAGEENYHGSVARRPRATHSHVLACFPFQPQVRRNSHPHILYNLLTVKTENNLQNEHIKILQMILLPAEKLELMIYE
jgi:hypothetical protein